VREANALILVDVQKGFLDPVWGSRNNFGAERVMTELLLHWRSQGWAVVHVQHLSRERGSPLAPGSSGMDFMDGMVPSGSEHVVRKNVNSAFIGTDHCCPARSIA
jgi:nicotinamidase-related amidase